MGFTFFVVQGRGKPQKARRSSLRSFFKHTPLGAQRVRHNAAIVQMRKVMRKTTVKRVVTPLVTVVVSLFLLSACEKPKPKARFDYSILSGSYEATVKMANYSENADSYEWTLTRPDGSKETSTSYAPSFLCWQVGTYHVTLYASNRYGMDRATQSFYINFYGGGNGGGGNGGGNGGGGSQTALAYTITWLRLEKIPMVDEAEGNVSWDTGLEGGGDPDIFFKIQNSTNTTTYYTSPVKSNVSESDFPVTWYNVNTTLEMGTEYRIRFLDEDSFTGHDDMANCIWQQAGCFSPGATSFTWYNTERGIKFTVGLSWIYNKSDNCEITQGFTDNNTVEGNTIPIHNHQ